MSIPAEFLIRARYKFLSWEMELVEGLFYLREKSFLFKNCNMFPDKCIYSGLTQWPGLKTVFCQGFCHLVSISLTYAVSTFCLVRHVPKSGNMHFLGTNSMSQYMCHYYLPPGNVCVHALVCALHCPRWNRRG